jgi:hypothetical protein
MLKDLTEKGRLRVTGALIVGSSFAYCVGLFAAAR